MWRSNTMETGTLCSLTIFYTYISTNLSKESVILMGRKWALFLSLSTITHTTSCPLGAFCRPMTKSIALFDPFPHWHFERLKLPSWPLVFSFHKLARKELCNFSFHATPPKLFLQILVHLVIAKMNSVPCLMSFIKNFPSQLNIIGNNCSPTTSLQFSTCC
jgi:hypothetical protein